jgi:hypothetical protein
LYAHAYDETTMCNTLYTRKAAMEKGLVTNLFAAEQELQTQIKQHSSVHLDAKRGNELVKEG